MLKKVFRQDRRRRLSHPPNPKLRKHFVPVGVVEDPVEPRTKPAVRRVLARRGGRVRRTFFSIRLRVLVIAEPAHGLLQRDFWCCLGDAELPDGFAAVVMHGVFGHFHPFEWNARRNAGDVRKRQVR